MQSSFFHAFLPRWCLWMPLLQWQQAVAATLMDSMRYFVSREPVVAQVGARLDQIPQTLAHWSVVVVTVD